MSKRFIFSLSIFLVVFVFLIFLKADSAEAVTISGRIYTDEGTTLWAGCPAGAGGFLVKASVNGGPLTSASCSLVQGNFNNLIANVTAPGDVITVFMDGAAIRAVTVTLALDTTTNINLDLYQNRLIVRHETIGPIANITNANLGMYDYTTHGDADIFFDVDAANNLLMNSTTGGADKKLIIWPGKIFNPSGNVTVPAMRVARVGAVGSTYAGANENLRLDGIGTNTDCTFPAGVVNDPPASRVMPLCVDSSSSFIAPNVVMYTGAGNVTISVQTYNYLYLWPQNALAGATYQYDSVYGNITVNNNLNLAIGGGNADSKVIFMPYGITNIRNQTIIGWMGGSGSAILRTFDDGSGFDLFSFNTKDLIIGTPSSNKGTFEVNAGNVTVTGNLTIRGSLLNRLVVNPSYTPTIFVNGNWINDGGTITPGRGTVVFQGSGQSIIRGGNDFYNLKVNAFKTLNFQFNAGGVNYVKILTGGNLNLKGSNWCSFLTLTCSLYNATPENGLLCPVGPPADPCSVGNCWQLDFESGANYSIEFVNVNNSNALQGVYTDNSINSGNNLNWNFGLFQVGESPYNLHGWAWAENIGWISFNSDNCDTDYNCVHNNLDHTNPAPGNLPASPDCAEGAIPAYGVNLRYDNYFEGYAWSERIGWIRFDPPEGNLPSPIISFTPPPTDGGDLYFIQSPARLRFGAIEGLTRACLAAPDQANCQGISSAGANTGGWAGWVVMQGISVNDDFTEKYVETRFNFATNEFYGWAWGGGGNESGTSNATIGMISFNHLNCDPNGDGDPSDGPAGCVEPGRNYINPGLPNYYPIPEYHVWYDATDQPPLPPTISYSRDPCAHHLLPPFVAFGTKLNITWTYSDPPNVNPTQFGYEIQIKEDSFFDQPLAAMFNIQVMNSDSRSYSVDFNQDGGLDWPPEACSISNAPCNIDTDCPAGQVCKKSLLWGQRYYYRVRVNDGSSSINGGWSDWSVPSSFVMNRHASPYISWERCPSISEPLAETQLCAKPELAVVGGVPGCEDIPEDPLDVDPPEEKCQVPSDGGTECYIDGGPQGDPAYCNSWAWVIEDAEDMPPNPPIVDNNDADATKPPVSSTFSNPYNFEFVSSGLKGVTLTVQDSSGLSCGYSDTIDLGLPLPDWKEIPPGEFPF